MKKTIAQTLSVASLLFMTLTQASYAADITNYNVIDQDTRVKVENTTAKPYQTITALTMRWDKVSGTCTGSVIAPNKVITAAHCVYNPKHGGLTKSTRITPGLNADYKPYGEFVSTHVRVPQQYMEKQLSEYDIAIIDVQPKAGASIGKVVKPFELESANDFSGKNFEVAGYPSDKAHEFHARTMWTDSGVIDRQEGNKAYYTTDASSGQSGAPLFDKTTHKLFVVHTSYVKGKNIESKRGTTLTADIYNWVKQNL
ncbi:trypsin-like serine protease [Staphylococcus schleiferi subsp. coagulans]|uniref:trypsin-like serine peptidase n=1 Tax=Staphylococcus coagulans TaxID=74706 RepID=UPI0015F979CA|nr:trypsin-like serine protease [Staphylococcus coagulans]MBA8760045.1 trypsin-like serine protease [Staphylococcus coagulans]MBA8768516.1 trypsin-like serine protease [Staphylococcus coagulans]